MFNHIEDSSGWKSCSNCGGGLHNTTDFWMAPFQGSPSQDGSSREFYVGGPSWTAALFYHDVSSWTGQYNWAHHFLWDFYIYVNESSMQNVWDLESDLYQAVGGYEYMIGTHCVFGSGDSGRHWEIYSQADHAWHATSAPCSRSLMPAGQWHHIQWYFERASGSTKYTYRTLVVNGKAYELNINAWAASSGWSDKLGVQWQIDTNSNGGSAHEWLDRAKLTIW